MFNTMFTTEKYFHFVLNLTVPFAVIFELPVVVMFLTSIGLLTAEFLIKIRRYAYVALIIIASCISPPDFLSHSLVAVPLICIYEISIALSKIVSKRKRKEKKKFSRKVPRYKGTFYPLGSKTPPQNLAKAKKLGGDQLPIKVRLVQLIISGAEENPTD